MLGGLILSLVWASQIGAQEQPILRFEGRVTYVAPSEMLVALGSGGVVMLDLARMPQGEIRHIAQNDYVTVIGFIRRPSRRVIASSPTGQPVGSDNSIAGALAVVRVVSFGSPQPSSTEVPMRADRAFRHPRSQPQSCVRARASMKFSEIERDNREHYTPDDDGQPR